MVFVKSWINDSNWNIAMRILVIEDDAEVRGMICKIFNDEGYDVLEAVNGKQGLRLLRDDLRVDLVVSDLIMPEKEGMETIRELRRDFPQVKILAISGGGKGKAQDYLAVARVMGADSTLAKPFVKDELLAAVQEVVRPG